MALQSFRQLFQQADQLQNPVSVVAVGGGDPTVLESLRLATARHWVTPTVTGNVAAIKFLARENQIPLDGFKFIECDQPAVTAVAEVAAGRASLLMKGQVATPDLLRAILKPESGLRTEQTICQVVMIELPHLSRRFLMADTGICIAPTIDQKIEIMNSSIRVAKHLGAIEPRVALMAATETETESMPESIDAGEITRRFAKRSENKNSDGPDGGSCFIQGPLSFDLAFDSKAGSRKHLAGPVVGSADVMIFPNLVSANLTVKAIMYTADCQFGGILCGAACPVVFMSRSDSTETRLRSLALGLSILRDNA